ncbi:MAG: carboxypeptidase-like regulatory domain-containing protein [Mangrovibacterium sp.]
MGRTIARLLCLFMIILWVSELQAENAEKKRFTVSGYVKDSSNGETLIGATILAAGSSLGTATNAYGFYSLSLDPGQYELQFGYIGFKTGSRVVNLKGDVTINIELDPQTQQLEEFEVVGNKQGVDLRKPEMGSASLPMKTIRQIPAMMGEVDLIKAIQLLPGVQPTSEGSSSFSVRGGSGDQNLILLDEATVYNASHLMGFFSVFNNDAINSVKIYKGDIPVWAGGRLASLLDVRMKEGNNKRFGASGGIGLLSSRLTLEGPIEKEKSSFILSGRRSYFDLFTALSSDEDIKDTKLYFYDLNGKVNFTLGENDRLYFSGYSGRDVYDNDFAGMNFGNRTVTTRWNHLFSHKVFSNLSLIYSKYDYKLDFSSTESNDYKWKYDMDDAGLKYDLGFLLSSRFELKTGFQWAFHTMHPGTVSSTGNNFEPYILETKKSGEGAGYVQAEQKIGERVVLRYGLRWSVFANRGADTVYVYNREYEETGMKTYQSGDYYNWQNGAEPRFGISYLINDQSSVKAGYARTRQYYQIATNSTSGTPLDLWFSSSPNVKPQVSDQWSAGYNRYLLDRKIELSAEVYYKHMQHTIDFKDHPELYFNRKLEGELRYGKSYAYGAEVMAMLNFKKLSGWVSYAYTRSERKIDQVADGEWFTSPFEKPHSVNIVLNYERNRKNSFGLNWVYATGQPATFPVGRMEYGNVVLPVYSDRNSERFPAYHRLDLSYTHKLRNWGKVERDLSFSLYNAYGRRNTWAIQFEADDDNPKKMNAINHYLFTFVPSITYNLKF